jgi:hypothetical protein
LTGMGTEEPTTWESYEDVARYLQRAIARIAVATMASSLWYKPNY